MQIIFQTKTEASLTRSNFFKNICVFKALELKMNVKTDFRPFNSWKKYNDRIVCQSYFSMESTIFSRTFFVTSIRPTRCLMRYYSGFLFFFIIFFIDPQSKCHNMAAGKTHFLWQSILHIMPFSIFFCTDKSVAASEIDKRERSKR